jgi:hypothetical protein
MLTNLILSNSLEVWSGNLNSEQNIINTQVQTASTSGINLVKDLILVTSFILSNSRQRNAESEAARKNTSSPISSLIALSAYWAIAALFVQVRVDEFTCAAMRNALVIILTSKITSRSHIEVSDEILDCSNHLPAEITKCALTNQLLARIRRALRSHLKNILLFAVILSISLHSELSATLHNPALQLSQNMIDEFLSRSDDNNIDIVNLIVSTHPQLALVPDAGSVGSTPLGYAASYRAGSGIDADFLDHKLTLGLCTVIATVAPSALAIADRLGMIPLHHAARKGHSLVMDYLSEHFHFTIPLKDNSGKTVIHHALLSSKQHDENSIIRLAKLCPRVLKDTNQSVYGSSANSSYARITTFDPLDYCEKNCSISLYQSLKDIYVQEKQKVMEQVTKLFLLQKLQQRHQQLIQQKTSSASSSSVSRGMRSPSSMVHTSDEGELLTETEAEEEVEGEEDESLHSDSSESFYSEVSAQSELLSMKAYSPEKVREQQQEKDNLLQLADTLLMLQSSKYSMEDSMEDGGERKKRQKVSIF